MKNSQSMSQSKQGLSLASVIVIFLICFFGFIGSVAAAAYFYVWPKILELRQQAMTEQSQENTQNITDPAILEKQRIKQAYQEAYKKTNELWKAENYKEASKSAQLLLENATTDEELVKAHSSNGFILIKLNKTKEAEAEFKKVLELNSDYYDAYQGLDEIYYNRKDYRSMLANANKAIEINPNSSLFYNEKGVALDGLNRVKEAIDAYKKAVELDPNNTVAKDNLKRVQNAQ